MRSEKLARSAQELIVIVVGVVIALAADRWIQTLDSRADERFYIRQLASDIRADSGLLRGWVDTSAVRNQTALDVLLYADEGGLPPDTDPPQFMAAIHVVPAGGTIKYTTDTWEDLVATGNLALIQDEELRTALSVYYNEVERVQGMGSGLFGSGTLFRALDRLSPPLQSLAVLRFFLPAEMRAEYRPTTADAERFLTALTASDEILTEFAAMRKAWTVSENAHKGLLEQSTHLLQRLEEYPS